MNNVRQDNDLIKEIIEKHFENMVDDVLEHTETYYEALGAITSIKGWNIPHMIHLADCLGKAIRKRAMQQKTPNHRN
jgi:gp12